MKNKTKLAPQVHDTVQAAAELLQRDEQIRITRCWAKINKALEEDSCAFDPMIILKAGQVIPQIGLIALPLPAKQNKGQKN